MPLYQRIKDLRDDADKTQTDIARVLGTTAQYYGKYEKGERELPLSRAVELADYYGVSLDYLAGRTNAKITQPSNNLTDDEIQLLSMFRELSQRDKRKVSALLNIIFS